MSNILNTLFWLAIICTAIAFIWYYREKNIAKEKGTKVTHEKRNLGYGLLILTIILGIVSFSVDNQSANSSDDKQAQMSSIKHRNKRDRDRNDAAKFDTENLFEDMDVTKSLQSGIDKYDVDNAADEVKEITVSKTKDKYSGYIKRAYRLIKEKKKKSRSTRSALPSSKDTNKYESSSYESSKKKSSNKVKVGGLSFSKVSLETFTANPDKYEGKNIQTSGSVYYIQKNPDNKTMYFVILVPTDEYSTSGYADGSGTVAQIDVDTMKESNIKTDDQITVDGSGLVGTVSLNGKEIASSIIVDYVK